LNPSLGEEADEEDIAICTPLLKIQRETDSEAGRLTHCDLYTTDTGSHEA
jgi:hypothetical protein